MDSTNPKSGVWVESINPPVYAEVIETVSTDKDDRVTVRWGVYGPGGDICEVVRLILPKHVAGAAGGSLLSSFGGKP